MKTYGKNRTVEDAFAQGCAKVGGIRARLAVSRGRVSNAVGLAISKGWISNQTLPKASREVRAGVLGGLVAHQSVVEA